MYIDRDSCALLEEGEENPPAVKLRMFHIEWAHERDASPEARELRDASPEARELRDASDRSPREAFAT